MGAPETPRQGSMIILMLMILNILSISCSLYAVTPLSVPPLLVRLLPPPSTEFSQCWCVLVGKATFNAVVNEHTNSHSTNKMQQD